MTDTAKHTLYICYFGLRQPLVQTQVIPYLREIAKAGIKVSLLTFEPELKYNWSAAQIESMRKELSTQNIEWDFLAYHKRPSAIATAYDIFAGARFIRRKISDEKIDVLHGRVHVATMMGAIARKFSKRKPKLIFDIRGFFPEEYTDAGVWPENGWLFRAAKRVERWLMNESDGFVVLTKKAREILFTKETRPIEVIPCCVDFNDRFTVNKISRREMQKRLGVEDRFVVAHVGALGGLYMTDEIVDFMEVARVAEPITFALILTQTSSHDVIERLRDKGFTERDYFVGQVDPAEIPEYLSVANAGLSFVKATYATQSRSPTKIPEYLAAGLPIIANSGVGDVDALINDNGVGVLLSEMNHESYLDAIRLLGELGNVSKHCREVARREFDLDRVGGERYRRLYRELLNNE